MASQSNTDNPYDVLFIGEQTSLVMRLVAALVRTLHSGKKGRERRVGAGWRLVDDPLEGGALLGGSFDDSRFPTARRELADGERIVGSLAGPGHFRRPSFRDPPSGALANTVVADTPAPLPPRVLRVGHMVIHPMAKGDWILECSGAFQVRGEPDPNPVRIWIRTTPLDLLQRCVATRGAPRTSFRGVRTPALLFEDLDLIG